MTFDELCREYEVTVERIWTVITYTEEMVEQKPTRLS